MMELREFFNKRPRTGILCTANRAGEVNAATINSTRMVDEHTIELEIGQCRTFEYLQENPKATYIIVEPGTALMDWRGIRVYMDLVETHSKGPKFEEARAELEKRTSRAAARAIVATLVFRVGEVRPLVDRGQGWEHSIKEL